MERIPAVVTGLGPISAIGCGRTAFWEALLAGRHGFGPISLCDVSHSPSKIGAEVRDFDLDEYVENGRALARHTPRPAQMALAAALLAIHDAELDVNRMSESMGVNVGTSIANLAATFSLRDRWRETGFVPAHAAFQTFPHSIACLVSSLLDLRGPIHTTSSGCNSGVDALGLALRMIQTGAVDAMLVIGVDSELVPEVIAALDAAGALATRYNQDPGRASRPFDRGRDGNVIGEGAAALVVEAEPHARARNARIYARLAGYAIAGAGRARQYSHDDPDMDLRPAVRALSGAIEDAGWIADLVDAVNANGSSSKLYDVLEARSLAAVFGERFPELPVTSIKSMLGQHGAGSSALQAVACCLSLRRGVVPPTINHDDPEPLCGPIRVVTRPLPIAPQRMLMHAIGFGGFYYSAAAFQAVSAADTSRTGLLQVAWSEEVEKFRPRPRFEQPVQPWDRPPG
jgi:3-oxoacyl-[acyl-carrier-protein] synthase II